MALALRKLGRECHWDEIASLGKQDNGLSRECFSMLEALVFPDLIQAAGDKECSYVKASPSYGLEAGYAVRWKRAGGGGIP